MVNVIMLHICYKLKINMLAVFAFFVNCIQLFFALLLIHYGAITKFSIVNRPKLVLLHHMEKGCFTNVLSSIILTTLRVRTIKAFIVGHGLKCRGYQLPQVLFSSNR